MCFDLNRAEHVSNLHCNWTESSNQLQHCSMARLPGGKRGQEGNRKLHWATEPEQDSLHVVICVIKHLNLHSDCAAEKLLLTDAMQKRGCSSTTTIRNEFLMTRKWSCSVTRAPSSWLRVPQECVPLRPKVDSVGPSSICMTSWCGAHSVEIGTKQISISYHFERKIILMFWRNNYFYFFVSMDASISWIMVLLPIGLWLWRISWSTKDQCIGVFQKLQHTSVQQRMLGPT